MDKEETKKKKEVKNEIVGRKKKKNELAYKINKEQTKFFVDLSKEEKSLGLVRELLVRANNKKHGDEISFKELALCGMKKLLQKDIEKIQEESLTEMEKVHRALEEYNSKNNSNLGLGEFLVKRLNIS
jgi:hypothetical protein